MIAKLVPADQTAVSEEIEAIGLLEFVLVACQQVLMDQPSDVEPALFRVPRRGKKYSNS